MRCRSTSLLAALLPVLVAALPLSVSLSASGEARAEEIEITSDRIIFGRDNSLFSMPAAGGDPTVLLALPWSADKVTRLRASADGSGLLVAGEGFTAWADLAVPDSLRFLPCSGLADISSDGNRVVCGTQDGRNIAVYTLRPSLAVRIIAHAPTELMFFGSEPDAIVGVSGDTIVDLNTMKVLSSHRPDHSLVLTPDGQRAMGSYQEDGIDIVYGFRLDGKAVKRTLMHAASSVATSADSGWAAIQQDADACAVRIVGGQYMCWRKVEALDISSAGHSLLVASPNEGGDFDLLLGAVRGTSSVKPTPLVEHVGHAAVFWPVSP